MSVTVRQFEYLRNMGIPVWQQHRHTSDEESLEQPAKIAISFEFIQNKQLFHDLLLTLHISIGEIRVENNTLNMGMFNWQFTEAPEISFQDNRLITPNIDILASSVSLKRQLWHTIFSHVM